MGQLKLVRPLFRASLPALSLQGYYLKLLLEWVKRDGYWRVDLGGGVHMWNCTDEESFSHSSMYVSFFHQNHGCTETALTASNSWINLSSISPLIPENIRTSPKKATCSCLLGRIHACMHLEYLDFSPS